MKASLRLGKNIVSQESLPLADYATQVERLANSLRETVFVTPSTPKRCQLRGSIRSLYAEYKLKARLHRNRQAMLDNSHMAAK